MMQEVPTRKRPWVFYSSAVAIWVVLDLLLSYQLEWDVIRSVAWVSLVFYIFYPLLFLFLFYYRLWDISRAFLLMFALMMVIEGVVLDNYQVYAFPELFLFIPLGLCVYSMVTIVPLWVAEKQLRFHRMSLALLVIGTAALGLLNIFFP